MCLSYDLCDPIQGVKTVMILMCKPLWCTYPRGQPFCVILYGEFVLVADPYV